MEVSAKLQGLWLRRGLLSAMLLPLSVLFVALVTWRRTMYRLGIVQTKRLGAPVVVVGNITVGGSGKTPLTLFLALQLRARGWHPGIISRGHGSRLGPRQVCEVKSDSDASEIGDEPLLLKRRSGLPLFVGRDRVEAGRALLLAYPACDVIISDDGLQHYRLARDVEIAVVDGRGLMNGWPMPAGPLREPAKRLREVDAMVLNGLRRAPVNGAKTFSMELVGASFYSLVDPTHVCEAAALKGLVLAAVVGIGAPTRFFQHLELLGLRFSGHVFPDHHRYSVSDIASIPGDALLMTEKDAVKCAGLVDRPVWVLPVTAHVAPTETGADLVTLVEQRILEKSNGRTLA